MRFSIFMVFGVGIGAAIYKTIGIHGAVAVDFVSFVISGLLIRSCKIPTSARLPNGKLEWKDISLKSSMGDFKAGIAYIIKNRLLAVLVFGFFIFGIVNGAFAILPMFTMKTKTSMKCQLRKRPPSSTSSSRIPPTPLITLRNAWPLPLHVIVLGSSCSQPSFIPKSTTFQH